MRRICGAVAAALLALCAAALPSYADTLQVAVTVDDLPAHGAMPAGMTRSSIVTRMAETFRRHGISKVYGFMNGAAVDASTDGSAVMLAWQRAGLPIANHTFSHLDLSLVTVDAYVADIARNESYVKRFGGGVRYFRYPYLQEGDTPEKRNTVRNWLASHGYTIAEVTVNVEAWAWNEAYARCLMRGDAAAVSDLRRSFVDTAVRQLTAFDRLARRIYGRPIRQILLLHAAAFTSVVLDDMLSAYRQAGVTFVDLEIAAADPVYSSDPGVIGDGRGTFLWQMAARHDIPMPPGTVALPGEEFLNRCH